MNEEQFFDEKPQANILQQIVQRYMPFWPVFLVLIALSIFIAHVYLRSQVKMYAAAAKVMISDPRNAKVMISDPRKSSNEMQVLEGITRLPDRRNMENEIILMRSPELMQEVVKDLNLYTTVFNEGNVQTEELYAENSPIVFDAVNKDSVLPGGKHKFEIDWNANTITIAGQKANLINGKINIGGTLYKVVPNEKYNKTVKGKNFFAVFNGAPGAASAFAGAIKAVQPTTTSSVLDVSMQTAVPKRGVDILNRLFEIYNFRNVKEKNLASVKTLQFIDERLRVVEGQLDSVEQNIMDYKSTRGITDLSGQASMYFGQVRELDRRNTMIDLQLEILDTMIDLQLEILGDIQGYVGRKGSEPGTVPSLKTVTDPFLNNLLNQLYTAEFELDKAKAVAGNQSESVVLAQERVSQIKKDLQENMNNIRSDYFTERASNNAEITKANSFLLQMPEKERGLLDINRQQAIKNDIYTYLLKRREETALATSATAPDLKVLQAAYSYGPNSPIPKNLWPQ